MVAVIYLDLGIKPLADSLQTVDMTDFLEIL